MAPHVSADGTLPVPGNGSEASVPIGLPLGAGLRGLSIYLQGAVLGAGLSLSNGAQLLLGERFR